MPDYKKKHVNRLRGAPKPKKAKKTAENISPDIEMKHSDRHVKKAKTAPEPKENSFKVVNAEEKHVLPFRRRRL